MPTAPNAYELFLDESGTFTETSLDPVERAENARRRRPFPSQLAGLLAPAGALTKRDARAVLVAAFGAADQPAPESTHGVSLRPGAQLDRIVIGLVSELQRRGWKPVRLTNVEGVSFGDRVATYTNMVAELATHVFRRIDPAGDQRVSLGLICAIVKLGEDEYARPDLMEAEAYLARLRESQARIAVRRGLAAESMGWEIRSVRTASARRQPELMLCDLVSNASHDDFKKLGPEARAALAEALGEFDFTLAIRELLARVDGLLADGAPGPALVALTERAAQGEPEDPARARRRERTLQSLAELGAPARDRQLAQVSAHLEQLARHRRETDEGLAQLGWLHVTLLTGLRARLGEAQHTIDWWEHDLHRLGLAASLDRGELGAARAHADALLRLRPALARRFEHAERVLHGQLGLAELALAALDVDEAERLAQPVVDFHTGLGALFADAASDVFPGEVHADLGARARLLLVRTRAARGDHDAARADAAQARAEFDSPRERAEVDVLAARWAPDADTAQADLARVLDCTAQWSEIARALAALDPESFLYAPALVAYLTSGARHAPCDAHAALHAAHLAASTWLHDPQLPHPAPHILRTAATLAARAGERDEALSVLAALRRRAPRGRAHLDQLTLIGAQAAVASSLSGAHGKHVERLLDHDDDERPGLAQLVARARADFAAWPAIVNALATTSPADLARALRR